MRGRALRSGAAPLSAAVLAAAILAAAPFAPAALGRAARAGAVEPAGPPASEYEEPHRCAVPPDMLDAQARLPNLAAAIRSKRPVKIVVIGGASTRGRAAGAPENAYPHRLQEALKKLYPGVPITVVNQGLSRQTARQMVRRFPVEVSEDDPALIVWEAGISDAVRGVDLDEFAAALQEGIDLAKSRAYDILLVDMQFSRRAATVIDFERYLDTIHRVGEMNGVYVFPRFAIMRYWSEENVFDYDDVPEGERARLAAKVYDCIGRTLAEAIRNAIGTDAAAHK